MLPIINGAYQQQNETNKKSYGVFISVSLLTIVLLLVMFQLLNKWNSWKQQEGIKPRTSN
jgi:CHASE3 domain sensor protein